MATATTTTSPAGYLISPDQVAWTPEDWADHFDGDGYACSVLLAADEASGLLTLDDLGRLLSHHGAELWQLRADLAELLPLKACHPINHAGQALTWLGY